jgi:hypothetical protein
MYEMLEREANEAGLPLNCHPAFPIRDLRWLPRNQRVGNIVLEVGQ